MDKEIEMTKKAYEGKKDIVKERLKPDISANLIEGKMCVETFDRFVDLENHIKTCHEKHTVFECDQCDKGVFF